MLIREMFSRDDAEAIIRIPLSKRDVPDSIVWLPNKDGVYSVKSGYGIARLLTKETDGMVGSSAGQNRGLIWQQLWKLHLPNKIKIFGCRLAMIFCQQKRTWFGEESQGIACVSSINKDQIQGSMFCGIVE